MVVYTNSLLVQLLCGVLCHAHACAVMPCRLVGRRRLKLPNLHSIRRVEKRRLPYTYNELDIQVAERNWTVVELLCISRFVPDILLRLLTRE